MTTEKRNFIERTLWNIISITIGALTAWGAISFKAGSIVADIKTRLEEQNRINLEMKAFVIESAKDRRELALKQAALEEKVLNIDSEVKRIISKPN